MSDDELLVRRDGAVAVITFNRPDALNAFRRATYQRLHALLGEFAADPSLRVVVLTGTGRGFCAGEDLKELEAHVGATRSEQDVRNDIALLQDITRRIAMSDTIFIAAVNGVAAGFGAELAIACDIRIGNEATRFLFPEVRRGLFITNGVSYLLQRIVGGGPARALLLTGEPIGSEDASRLGLVTARAEGAAIVDVAVALAHRIAWNATLSVTLTKRILREVADGDLEHALALEVEYALACFHGGAHEEGARAFVEKRDARFNVVPPKP